MWFPRPPDWAPSKTMPLSLVCVLAEKSLKKEHISNPKPVSIEVGISTPSFTMFFDVGGVHASNHFWHHFYWYITILVPKVRCSILLIDVLKDMQLTQGLVPLCEGLIVLHESEFERLDNDTLLFQQTFNILGYNDSSPIICSNFSQNGTVTINETGLYYSYPPAFSILTHVGCCSLSVVGCVVVLLTYITAKRICCFNNDIC